MLHLQEEIVASLDGDRAAILYSPAVLSNIQLLAELNEC